MPFLTTRPRALGLAKVGVMSPFLKHEKLRWSACSYRTGVKETGIFQLHMDTQSIQMMLWVTGKDEHG